MDLIIFDMDGLMFDTEAVTFRAFQEVWAAEGFQTTLPQYCEFLGLDYRATCDKYKECFGEGIDAEVMYHRVGQRLREIIEQEGLPVKEGLYELLDVIEEKKLRKVIASGSGVEAIRGYLQKAGLEGRFDMIISSEEVQRGKPYPDIFLEICARQQVSPEKALVLEDSPAGIKAACAGGIPVIGIPDLRSFTEETKGLCVTVEDTLRGVIPLILEEA